MKVLAVNAGSSSLKFKMYEMPQEDVLIYGYIEKIGEDSLWKIIKGDSVKEFNGALKDHNDAVKVLMDSLFSEGIINSLDEIDVISHRIVNGAGAIEPRVVDDKEIKRLSDSTALSKVHMPGHIAGIKAFRNKLPNTKQIVVFDTAFHHSIPKENFLYAIPYEWYLKYNIRKYGFHGISCNYITDYMEKELGRKVNIIICHIGNGASVTAVKDSKSYNTSMGFTANAGLIMGSRCGDIDYSFLPYLAHVSGMSLDEIDDYLNKNSGLEGLAPGSSDNRDMEKMIANGDDMAILANKMYVNRIVSYIASYIIYYDNLDGIVFCGGAGENACGLRKSIIDGLSRFGIILDDDFNKKINKFSSLNKGVITDKKSAIKVYVIPTDEEVMLAREAYNMARER